MTVVGATDGKDGVRMTDSEGARVIQIRMTKDRLPGGFSVKSKVAVVVQMAWAGAAFLVVSG